MSFNHPLKSALFALLMSVSTTGTVSAQQPVTPDTSLLDHINHNDPDLTEEEIAEEIASDPFSAFITDTIQNSEAEPEPLRLIAPSELPSIAFLPVVFDRIDYVDSLDFTNPEPLLEDSAFNWIKIEAERARRYRDLKQNYMIHNPAAVRYNINTLPSPPKKYVATVDPQQSVITIKDEIVTSPVQAPIMSEATQLEVTRRNWLHDFSASLQFSQAYISPNWYQGGNNNVNMIGNVRWNVKLNNKFHPNLIAEATTQYKLAIASAPQDEVHNYTISEDLFQFNGTLGLKAFNNWYYSLNGMFKTQFLNSYPPNSNDMKAAFLSPGELNLGVGMTYNYTNPKKKFKVEVSIAPLSYNLKMSTSERIPVTNFGISEGRHSVSEVGSNAEVKVAWDIVWNISYLSRLFVFTDYDYVQGDWENTINFSINRYLSTQLYVHLRYDSSQPSVEGSRWHKWQLKEILSFGLQYQFKTI